MLRISQLIRAQCRRDLRRPLASIQHLLYRTQTSWEAQRQHSPPPPPVHGSSVPHGAPDQVLRLYAEEVPDYFARNVRSWLSLSGGKTKDRLVRFGMPDKAVRPLLKKYASQMRSGNVFRQLNYSNDQLSRIAHDISNDSFHAMDRYLTKMLYEWASLPEGQETLELCVPPEVVSCMQTLYRAADLSEAGWEFPWTRRMPPRKFIMHVGPTNSGKTHNALRALAAAKRGIYAGPLRLLAYEIFDRLNKGQIVPLGMDPDPQAEPDSRSNIDLGEDTGQRSSIVVTKQGNPKYARKCNMLTGEEHKIVDDDAPLLSCTVEMAPFAKHWDVAVIDEIQLISDKQRGGAWTSAVLGLHASEIHLCGEEAAVPLIEALVRELGDTIEINRYSRLTPLVVAEKSLEGDLARIKDGDCVVAFSRGGLFGLKHSIEEANKMRCALAYGRLPPEIRSEQAALFNDPDSDYNVLVGSDAVGMGLNLKIKRVVFESVAKFDGSSGMRTLSTSQIKQIAGRAGRFGLHQGDSAGVVTTLHPGDLDVVREALTASSEPLRYARLNMNITSFTNIVRALPRASSSVTVAEAYHYVSKTSPLFEFKSIDDFGQSFRFIDSFSDCLTLPARLLTQNSPCPWRDGYAVTSARAMMEIYRDKLQVPIEEMLHRARLLKKLNKVFVLMEGSGPMLNSKEIMSILNRLETLHKIVVLYLWFSYRYVAAFPDQSKAFKLRQMTELAMDWCLEVLHQMRLKAKNPAAFARKAVMMRRPLAKQEETPKAEEGLSDRNITPELLSNPQGMYIHHIVR